MTRAKGEAVKALVATHGMSHPHKCDPCGLQMRITARAEHPEKGPAYELQTFTCPHCNHVLQATVATPGAMQMKKAKR